VPALLFVCHANICRSPLAEAIVRHQAAERGVLGELRIASAGTWAADGARPHRLGIEAAIARGIDEAAFPVGSRPIGPDDLFAFDHVLLMDRRNLADLERLRRMSAFGPVDGRPARVRLLRHVMDPGLRGPEADVPDPVGGGRDDFDRTCDLLWRAGQHLLDELYGPRP
jgi:protein-tyrosine phosphatase